jgi:hypothetical protein
MKLDENDTKIFLTMMQNVFKHTKCFLTHKTSNKML